MKNINLANAKKIKILIEIFLFNIIVNLYTKAIVDIKLSTNNIINILYSLNLL